MYAFMQCAPEATEFSEIMQNKGHYAVQGHSRSPWRDYGRVLMEWN